MKLRVYAGQSCFVVVPDFLLPPAATARYEPLIFQGFMEDTQLHPDELELVQYSIEQYFYAIVPESLGEKLSRSAGAGWAGTHSLAT